MDGRALTGQNLQSGDYVLATWLFLRVLGVIYLVAFVSLAVQVKGLVGKNGILPLGEFLRDWQHGGAKGFWRSPTLSWFNTSDGFLLFLAWGGTVAALLEIIGVAPIPMLVMLWVFYLSLATACRVFLGYQWDILLLETGFLAIFLAPLELLPHFPPANAPSPIILWLLWWLLFRLMFSSGVVKLRSGDVTWKKLTALRHHYETQPLPTPVAWHFHQMPIGFHKFSAVLMFAIELLAPFLIFAPPPGRYIAAALFVSLMFLIQLTGNYCFFNLLGIALSLLLLDDKLLGPPFGWVFPNLEFRSVAIPAPAWWNWMATFIALLILILSLARMFRLFLIEITFPKFLMKLFQRLEPLRLVNSYGLFSVMTTQRPEIIVEGSNDSTNWMAYEFKWKPGDVKRPPSFVAPHQPRLDWQMWFAALGHYEYNPWFHRFLICLLDGSPDVLSLLKTNPFPGSPPRYIRAVLYDYRFTDRSEHRATGAWWKRERRGWYCPIVELE